jgi:isopenicillin N synthase-like dioxygenase
MDSVAFSAFLNGSGLQRREAAKELTKSIQQNGFVKLTDYGIPSEIVDNILPWVRGSTAVVSNWRKADKR